MPSDKRELHDLLSDVTATIAIDYASRVGQLPARNLTALARVFSSVLFTGWFPYLADDLRRLLLVEDSAVTIDADDQLPLQLSPSVVVVGGRGFSKEAIEAAVDQRPGDIRILPQEGFLDQVLFGYDWWTEYQDLLNGALEYHDGLQFARSLADRDEDFAWPTGEPAGPIGSGRGSLELGAESFLYRMGYSVAVGGPSRSKRQLVLEEAVREHGLRPVAHHIAWQIESRKRMKEGPDRYGRAIGEWQHDLDWLRRRFYNGGFRWPTP